MGREKLLVGLMAVTTIARIFIQDDLIRALSLDSAKCSKKYTKTPSTYDAASLQKTIDIATISCRNR